MLNRQKLKVRIVTVPFSGHSKILVKLAQNLLMKHPEFDIEFIVTGWKDIDLSVEEIHKLEESNIPLKIINTKTAIPSANPMDFNLSRVEQNAEAVIEATKDSDYIIYDFFALEGYLAGKQHCIPAVCSMPAIIGPFNPQNPLFQEGLQNNADRIAKLEKQFNVCFQNKLEMVSDAFYIPSDTQNIIWSWESFIKASDYHKNRNKLATEVFMRPELPPIKTDPLIESLKAAKSAGKKIIYVSLGTVVTKNLWDHEPMVKQFVNDIFSAIIDRYRQETDYEVVISAGRNPNEIDVLRNCPKHFHIAESVNQIDVLRQVDVFVTHGGGNSVNDAIDIGTPMVAIPFFGDQHITALNIDKLKIGKSFLHEEKDSEIVVSTHAQRFHRNSLTKESLLAAIEEVLNNSLYKNNIAKLKQCKPASTEKLSKAFINRKIMNWQEGDLLYGPSIDRNRTAEMTFSRDFMRMGDETPFTQLFADSHDTEILPRIIDQYNDVLKRKITREQEYDLSPFTEYKKNLQEFENFLRNHPEYLQPIGDLDHITPDQGRSCLETLWSMCLGGIDYFTHHKANKIHFVIGSYNCLHSEAPMRELQWIKDHWNDDKVREHVQFYYIHEGLLKPVDPIAEHWFQQSRPTPTLADVAPRDFSLNQNTWNVLQTDIIKTAQNRSRFFKNHLRDRYPTEMKAFKNSGLERLSLTQDAKKVRASLESTDVHIFALLSSDRLILVKKQQQGVQISHAVAAQDEPVLCAGEVRLRPIMVNGKIKHVLDISNDSGHYRPDASNMPKVIAAFEASGYHVHRANVIHTQIPESFNKVEANSGFAPLCKK